MNNDSEREASEPAREASTSIREGAVQTVMPAKRLRFGIGLRWWMMALIMLGSILNYLSRQTLSVAVAGRRDLVVAQAATTQGLAAAAAGTSSIPQVVTAVAFAKLDAGKLEKDDTHDSLQISDRQYGIITSAFQITIMLQPICGYILDVIGLRIGLAIFVVGWSLISIGHARAGSWRGLAVLRGLMGFAEGSANPAGMRATAEWFPAKERGVAGGFYNIGASAGIMLAGPLVALAVAYSTWQTAFIISGVVGLVWVALWLFFYDSPSRHPWLSDQERTYIRAGQEKHLDDVGKPSIRQILRQPNFWGIALPRFFADPTWGALTLWLPRYFANERGFNLNEIALFLWLPFLAADFGCIFGGLLAAWLQKRFNVSLINARRMAFTVGTALMISVPFAALVESPYIAVVLFSVAGFAHQTLSVTVITMSSDLFRRGEVATVAGLAGTCGNAGVLIFTASVGALVAVIGYTPFFVCLSVLDIIGAIVLWTLVRERRDHLTNEPPAILPEAGPVNP